MGGVSGSKRIDVGVSHTPPSESRSLVFQSASLSGEGRIASSRDHGSARKGCHRTGYTSNATRVLCEPFSSNQSIRGLQTSHGSLCLEQIHYLSKVQDGEPKVNNKSSGKRTMGGISGFKRCLPPRTCEQTVQKVLKICIQEPNLPMQSSSIWSEHSPSGVYKINANTSGICSQNGGQGTHISRRLANTSRVSRKAPDRSAIYDEHPGQSRVSHKYPEIRASTYSRHSILGNQAQTRSGPNVPLSWENSEDLTSTSKICTVKICNPQAHFKYTRPSSLNLRSGSTEQTEFETSSVLVPISVESFSRDSGCFDSIAKDTEEVLSSLASHCELSQGCTLLPPTPTDDTGNRCISDRVGGTHGGRQTVLDDFWHMVSRGEKNAHKSTRTTGNQELPSVLGESGEKQITPDSHRQHHCDSLHQEPGRYSLYHPDPECKDLANLGRQQKCSSDHEAHSRIQECTGRQPIQEVLHSKIRMDAPQGGDQRTVQYMGLASSGPLCNQEKLSISQLCFPLPRQSGISHGRSECILETRSKLCISSNPSDTASTSKTSEGGGGTDSNSSILAESCMVSTTTVSGIRHSKTVTPVEKASHSRKSRRAEPRSDESIRLEIVRKNFTDQGFSLQTANFLAQGRRQSTLTNYAARWAKFSTWCSGKEVDPISASIPVISDFLVHLFQSGSSVNTIRNYRSAISATSSIGGLSMASDRRLNLLIDSFWLKRPRVRNKMPEWRIDLVLQALCDFPFEPIRKISLKFLTYKTVFLLAMATSARVSELSAFSCGSDYIRYNKVTKEYVLSYKLGFLKKNQKADMDLDPVRVPSLSKILAEDDKERVLCPVRALSVYLDRTKAHNIRKGSPQLFVPIIRTKSNEVSRSTISRWIIATIIAAYENLKEDRGAFAIAIKAHEVRAVSVSLARLAKSSNAFSTREIMDSVGWKSSNAFLSFYLRDLSASLQGLKPTKSVVVASREVQI